MTVTVTNMLGPMSTNTTYLHRKRNHKNSGARRLLIPITGLLLAFLLILWFVYSTNEPPKTEPDV
jgi:hypothetical protein